ncbi:MAG: TIGR03067 domain-containing protein [Gemmataceae bacterium]|nr:TIGR03067 domain-containing protein [Gemmataceae bacterium]
MRKLIAAAFLAVVVPVSRADDAADAAKKLEGTYTLVEFVRGGKADAKKAERVEAVEIKDGAITIKTPGGKEPPARFTVDPSRKPAPIDLKADQKEIPGIYQTKDAADGFELTIAFARNGADRPKDFKGEGPAETVIKLRRKKTEK